MPVIIPTITFYANNVVSVVSLDSTPYYVIQNSMGSFIYGLKELYLKGAKFLVSENPTFNTNDYPNFNFKNIYDKNLKIFRLELK